MYAPDQVRVHQSLLVTEIDNAEPVGVGVCQDHEVQVGGIAVLAHDNILGTIDVVAGYR
jgi:hypothetical protein